MYYTCALGFVDCEHGGQKISDDGACYLVELEEPSSWHSAAETCSVLHGSLVSIYSEYSSSTLTSLLASYE